MLGIIGGSGLYSLENFTEITNYDLETPFGSAGRITELELDQTRFFFLSRHGVGHALLPHEINYRANIYALKQLGVRTVISVSAVGSLREELSPGSFVLPTQFIDFTKSRKSTFFGDGLLAHVSTADPVCPVLLASLQKEIVDLQEEVHLESTYLAVEGPRFGTRAESQLFRQFGADILGMTLAPEIFLAREAQLAYANLSVVTDYDCTRESEQEVEDQVNMTNALMVYRSRINIVQKIIYNFIKTYQDKDYQSSPARTSLDSAVFSEEEDLNEEQISILKILQK